MPPVQRPLSQRRFSDTLMRLHLHSFMRNILPSYLDFSIPTIEDHLLSFWATLTA